MKRQTYGISLVGQVAVVTSVVGASRSQAGSVGVWVVGTVSGRGRGVVLVEDILDLVDDSRHDDDCLGEFVCLFGFVWVVCLSWYSDEC